MPADEPLPGLVVKAQSGFFDVQTERGRIVSVVRGRLKQERRDTDVVALGDRVWIQLTEDGTGAIERVAERTRALSRRAPGGDRQQVIVANPDQMMLIFACADPDPNFRMLDRMLVVAEREAIPAVIVANKLDLVNAREAKREFALYQRMGYPVLLTSAKTKKGVKELRRRLRGKISVLSGPSGAGKSSLLNAMYPGLSLPTRPVSHVTGKGLHATVYPELLPLPEGGYVADTPGLRSFALWDVEPEELDGYFRDIRPYVSGCAFSDCTHTHEPDCAVIAAVEVGKISRERYESYVRMREGE